MALTSEQQQNLDYALEWLDRSRKDSHAFRLLVRFDKNTKEAVPCSDPALAVYLLQQAIEKAVKSAAAATGKFSYQKLRRHLHNSLLVLLDFYQEILNVIGNRAQTKAIVEKFFGLDIAQQQLKIKAAETEASKPSRGTSADEIDKMLDKLLAIRNETFKKGLKQVFGTHSSVTLDLRGIDSASPSQFLEGAMNEARNKLALPELTDDQKDVMVTLLQGFIEDRWKSEEIPEKIVVPRDTEGWLENWSLIALLFLALITWPHEGTSRYPGPRGSRSGQPAGCNDYSYDLGIVDRLGRLGYVTLLAMDGLKPQLEAIAGFSSSVSNGASLCEN
jgi:hypothetical protein